MANEIMLIAPYWYQGHWVFDDEAVGLDKEPFVAGIPEMIDALVADMPDSRNGFRMLFSLKPFPGFQGELTWIREEHEGHWYKLEGQSSEGWLCPSLLRYFDEAPTKLYVKAEQLRL